jgi:protein phosphatase
MSTELKLPGFSLVLLIGASGSGKSTFAAAHFKTTEILSSDRFRGMISDDENDQSVTDESFELLHQLLEMRLKRGRFTVIDATNIQAEDRRPFLELAKKYHCAPSAMVLNMSRGVCLGRNRTRSDRQLPEHAVDNQLRQVRHTLRTIKNEGFRHIYILNSPEEVETAVLLRQRMRLDHRHEHGPFDIIGDVHGCFEETVELMQKLGYYVEEEEGFSFGKGYRVCHPEGRKVIFVGDLVDRGPGVVPVLRLVMSAVEAKRGFCVPGNHDMKLVRKLNGKHVQIKYGLAESLEQLEHETPAFKKQAVDFLRALVAHYVLDDGKLVVAHAGMKEKYQGRSSNRIRAFALYGETTGETDEFGLPVRLNWAAHYRGKAMVVYGHTPMPRAEWLNNTINIDTGCVFGGALTALRYPEKELVSVPAKKVYTEPVKPLRPRPDENRLSLQQRYDELLDVQELTGKLVISTSIRGSISIREGQTATALEEMSRFTVDPKWLIYLPPTMSPTSTTKLKGYLEFPGDVFQYYLSQGVDRVICQEKHMGARMIAIVCKNTETAIKRFGVTDGKAGICYTRTGRIFFDDQNLENQLLDRIRSAMDNSGLWDTLKTDWVCLDGEFMPWSFRSLDLARYQYGGIASAAKAALADIHRSLQKTAERNIDVQKLLERTETRNDMALRFLNAYRHYCRDVKSIDDMTFAPFHIMAAENQVFTDKKHTWHLEQAEKLHQQDPKLLLPTQYRTVNLNNEKEIKETFQWWHDKTDNHGWEGIVVKPLDFFAHHREELVQPAIKCRGKEFLRLVYGPEYTFGENLTQLRKRGLYLKRSLAARQFALSTEALHRFTTHQPLLNVHQCIIGIIGLNASGGQNPF